MIHELFDIEDQVVRSVLREVGIQPPGLLNLIGRQKTVERS